MTETTKRPDPNDKMSTEDYENLLDKYQYSTKEVTAGKVVKGRVIRITPTHVLVDIGLKSEGVIPIEEFTEAADPVKPKPGDEVEAVLEKTDRKEGYFVLSKKSADIEKALDNLEKAFSHQHIVSGRVVERIKNGYTVNVGLPAFLPDSHADIRIVKDPEKLIGQTFKFKVIKFDRKDANAVVSRKLFLIDEKEKKRRKVFAHLAKEQHLAGVVKSLTNFGAFVDVGGVEGLLHVSDMSWGKIGHPSELFHQAAPARSLVQHRREIHGRPADHGQSHEPDRFRGVRRAREGRRGPGPHLRPQLVAEDDPSEEAPEFGR
jgi:small subunit ribosomal protein S1